MLIDVPLARVARDRSVRSRFDVPIIAPEAVGAVILLG